MHTTTCRDSRRSYTRHERGRRCGIIIICRSDESRDHQRPTTTDGVYTTNCRDSRRSYPRHQRGGRCGITMICLASGGSGHSIPVAGLCRASLGDLIRTYHSAGHVYRATTGERSAPRIKVVSSRGERAGLDASADADWVIVLGPEGGTSGGQLVIAGTPEAVAACPTSHTGRALVPFLERRRPPQ